jgi:mRNA-degrading endonuclease YafQ of YafQ-DinJ toxin-antitoxin module
MGLLKEAMVLLIKNDGALGAEWKDHALKVTGKDIESYMLVEIFS